MALVDKKASHGEIENVEQEEAEERRSADIIDLTELLKRSLGGAKVSASPSPAKRPTKSAVNSAGEKKPGHKAAGDKKASNTKKSTKPKTSATTRSKPVTKKTNSTKPASQAKKASR